MFYISSLHFTIVADFAADGVLQGADFFDSILFNPSILSSSYWYLIKVKAWPILLTDNPQCYQYGMLLEWTRAI